MIKPTVGRVVWYHPTVDDHGAKPLAGQPLAAIIAAVWSDACINISYFDANGVARSKTSVLLVQEDQPCPEAGYAEWMPFQKGQAAKTEAVQREAVEALLDTRIPILEQITDLCYAIEKCGASPELTDAVTKASALREPISELVRQALALGVGAGIVSVSVSPQPSPSAGEGSESSRDVPGDAIEQEIQVKGLTAPRITPADIEASIASEHYFIASDAIQHQNAVHACGDDGWYLGATQLLTFCVLQLRNGFTVTGESACASPENFDAEIGRKIARQNAVAKVWPLLGYELRTRLAGGISAVDPEAN